MRIFATIPVRSPGDGKRRLQTVLDREARASLTRAMFARVLDAALGASLAGVIVVSRDRIVLHAAAAAGACPLEESGEGLNEALALSTAFALGLGAEALLVLPADLPLIDSTDIAALTAALRPPPAVVIAPDASGTGTAALLVSPPDVIPFRFGAGSLSSHLDGARAAEIEPVVVRRPRLGFDVDTPADLETLEMLPGALTTRRRLRHDLQSDDSSTGPQHASTS